MTCPLTEIVSGNFRQPALYPPCLPDGYPLVSVSSSRRMDCLPGTQARHAVRIHTPNETVPEKTHRTSEEGILHDFVTATDEIAKSLKP